jgi:hypothetical protein
MSAEADCELCGVRLPTLTQLRRHLGKHQEELSLFALPSYMKEDDGEVDEDDVEIDSVASVANSEGSLSPAQITCEHCSLSIDDDHDGQVALHLHIQNVHGQSKTGFRASTKQTRASSRQKNYSERSRPLYKQPMSKYSMKLSSTII